MSYGLRIRRTAMTTQTEMTMNPVATNAFAWNEIATRETKEVSAFYCELFGWTAELAECTAGYTVFKIDDMSICGMIEMNDEWPKETPTHWGSYIYVEDVDATAAKVTDAGGTVCCGPMDAGEGARMAVITDSTGAIISLYKGGDGQNAFGAGAFCWNELCTDNTEASAKFYADVFGWNALNGPESECPYTIFQCGEEFVGGMMEIHWDAKPSWLGYVAVDDVDVAASKAAELGAQLCVEPQDSPNIGRFAVFTDPVGGTVGLFKSNSPCCGESDCCS
jgi:hypothetical protein